MQLTCADYDCIGSELIASLDQPSLCEQEKQAIGAKAFADKGYSQELRQSELSRLPSATGLRCADSSTANRDASRARTTKARAFVCAYFKRLSHEISRSVHHALASRSRAFSWSHALLL